MSPPPAGDAETGVCEIAHREDCYIKTILPNYTMLFYSATFARANRLELEH